MKYCGVSGFCVYTHCAVGMSSLETAMEEMLCQVLDKLLQGLVVNKWEDDLYCRGSTSKKLL